MKPSYLFRKKIGYLLLCYYVYGQQQKSVAVNQVSFQGKILELPAHFLLHLHRKEETDLEKPLKVIPEWVGPVSVNICSLTV